jgi:Nif-specific regulatory protein
MDTSVNRIILSQIEEKYKIFSSIDNILTNNENVVVEIIGGSGTGKSIIYTELLKTHSNKTNVISYIPERFCFNQIINILNLITKEDIDITEDFHKLIEESVKYEPTNKYDIFYFLTEKFAEMNYFIDRTIFIDNADLLDNYTRNFIEFYIQYNPKNIIKFILFTTKSKTNFSIKFNLTNFSLHDIQKVISHSQSYLQANNDFNSELLYNISDGNIQILILLLNNKFQENDEKVNLISYLESNKNLYTFFKNRIQTYGNEAIDLLIYIHLLDNLSTDENLETIFENKFLSTKNHLINEEIIEKVGNRYISHYSTFITKYFLSLRKIDQRVYVHKIIDIIFNNVPSKIVLFHLLVNEYNENLFLSQKNYFYSLRNFDIVTKIITSQISKTLDIKLKCNFYIELGMIKQKNNELEAAAEDFRTALKIAKQNQFQADKIVYYLAETLYNLNSAAFALEIIKKFIQKNIDQYWKAKILILKSEILSYQEEFEESLSILDSIFESSFEIKDSHKKNYILATIKKTIAKVYYQMNQWNKAEQEFNDAAKYYNKIDDYAGMAAISNNIGVIALFKGDWEKASKLYLQSLDFEKKRYNLNGISVCYNNIGYLVEEHGDFNESLKYFNDALRIQKMLGDRNNVPNIYLNIGVTYMDNGFYKEALEAFQNSLQVAISFNLFKNIVAALNNLGSLYLKWGDWNKSIEYFEQAIKKSKENDFFEGLLHSYNNLGEFYSTKGEDQVAYDLYFHGLEIIDKVNDDYLKAEVKGNIGKILTQLHKFSEAYPYLIESYDYFKSLPAKDKMSEGCLNIANYFLKTRNYESALYYINKSIQFSQEISDREKMGKAYVLKSELEFKNPAEAKKHLKNAITIFLEINNNFELAKTNYLLAELLNNEKEWEEALTILENNENTIRKFGSVALLEKNDLLIQKITKEHQTELANNQNQGTLLTKFYETTKELNAINNFDILLETSLDRIMEISGADGGMLCLYNNRALPESWEYKSFRNFSKDHEDYDIMMDIAQESYNTKELVNYKQVHFAPQYNNIICFPLIIRNDILGILLIFIKNKTSYFQDKILSLINALCNQIVVIIDNLRHSNLAKSHAIIREELNSGNPFSNIIGKSDKLRQIFEVIEKIKDTPTTVLLEGESGTGKELIARAIHYTSNRRNKKFIAQYCGALPETLLESELFGHVKGSFTGATYDKKGLLEIAAGGTFFLDEIGDISLSTQVKLLRFLQEGEIKRVGSTQTRRIDVRVICATNATLSEKVKKGEFRLDLYYRLNVIKINVPSLKERKSDIPLLAIHFLDKYNKKMNKTIKGITDEAMKYLIKCEWPGNIRQLENEIERAVTLVSNDSFIKPDDLSEEVFKYFEHTETLQLLKKVSLKDAVEELERDMIIKALKDNNWNQTQAAKELGLSRQGLIKKIKRYELAKYDI